MRIERKKENGNAGFHYPVTNEPIKADQRLNTEEIMTGPEEPAKFIYDIQPLRRKGANEKS